MNPGKSKEIISLVNKGVGSKKSKKPSHKKIMKQRTINTNEIHFNEWYDENKSEIDIVFGSLLGIYTSKKVVFYQTRNELYTLFVQKYYRKVNKR